jgi:hypothetical protein
MAGLALLLVSAAAALPTLVAVLVLGDHLQVVLTGQAAQVAAVLQVQQTPVTLEQSTRVAAVLVILTEQTTQPLDTLAVLVVLVLSLFATQTPTPPQHQPRVHQQSL